MDARGEAVSKVDQVRRWLKSDPKNVALAVTTPLSVWETISQARWQRQHGRSALSLRGALAYVRARPLRFAYGVALSVLPSVVDRINRRGGGQHRLGGEDLPG
jgi:hypothetical protein